VYRTVKRQTFEIWTCKHQQRAVKSTDNTMNYITLAAEKFWWTESNIELTEMKMMSPKEKTW